MSKKILVLGIGQNNFLSYLYSNLKKHNSNFYITAPFYSEINKESTNDSWMYSNDSLKNNTNFLNSIKASLHCLFSKHFYHTFFFILFVEGKIAKAFHFCFKQVQAKSFFIQNNNFDDYAIFHFHFMQYSYLRELFLIPKNKKIVCSFWGSDLLRTHDIFNFYFVKKALNRATVITCQSIELREIILSKYGRNLYDKIQVSIFPVDEKIYDFMKLNYDNQSKIDSFKQKYSYSKDKINVLIGHSGSIFNNHLEILNSLQTLKNKNQIHIIINLNYAITEIEKRSYKVQLEAVLNELHCSFVILERFFAGEELAVSRLASDIFLHAPISDALSGTMLELLYGSNIVVTGSWLPYKTFRKADLLYKEVDEIAAMGLVLDSVITNYSVEKDAARSNTALIENYFFNKNIIQKWVEILS